MSFQIIALPAEPFEELFMLNEAERKARNICRMQVTSHPGTPCRVSLVDADVGDTVLLLNYHHQSAPTPYRSSHAIFVRHGVSQAKPAVGQVPAALRSRLISIRPFDHQDMLQDPDLVEGVDLADALIDIFKTRNDISYVHLHYAKAGCFAAQARRA